VSEMITMRHPTLPKDQEIEVPREAMPHYTLAGWQLVPQEELDERAAAKAKADAEAAEATAWRGVPGPESVSPAAEPEDEPEQSEPAEPTNDRPARSRTKTAAKTTEES